MGKENIQDTLEQLAKRSGQFPDELVAYVGQASEIDPELLKSAFQGSFDLTNIKLYQFASVYPSSFIRKAGFYVQGLLDVQVGKNYYTVREGMPSWMLLMTIEGQGRLRYMERDYVLRSGDLFLIDARRLQDYRADADGWRYRLIHFNARQMEDYFQPVLDYRQVVFPVGLDSAAAASVEEIFRMYQDDFNIHGETVKELRVSLLLQNILTELLISLPSIDSTLLPDWIRAVCLWIPEHCTEELQLEDIATVFAASKYHLSREFHRYTKRKLMDYWSECRIDKARQLLRNTLLPISVIAEKVGYHDQMTFARAFKRYEKTSPSEYRKEWQFLFFQK